MEMLTADEPGDGPASIFLEQSWVLGTVGLHCGVESATLAPPIADYPTRPRAPPLGRYLGRWLKRRWGAAGRLRPASRQGQEPLVVDVVTLAGGRLEALAIQDGELAAMIADEPRAVQLTDRFGDPGAPHPEHRRQELVGH